MTENLNYVSIHQDCSLINIWIIKQVSKKKEFRSARYPTSLHWEKGSVMRKSTGAGIELTPHERELWPRGHTRPILVYVYSNICSDSEKDNYVLSHIFRLTETWLYACLFLFCTFAHWEDTLTMYLQSMYASMMHVGICIFSNMYVWDICSNIRV